MHYGQYCGHKPLFLPSPIFSFVRLPCFRDKNLAFFFHRANWWKKVSEWKKRYIAPKKLQFICLKIQKMSKKTQAFILITSKLELFSGQSLFLPCFLENKKPFLFHASIPWPENFQVNMHQIYDLVIHKHKTSRDFANLLVVCETCTLKIHKFSYSKKVQKRFFHLANTFTPPSQFAICHHSLLSLS